MAAVHLGAFAKARGELMFFRDKDRLDLKRLWQAQGPRLDSAWIRKQIIALCGLHDPRLATLDELITSKRSEDSNEAPN